jgi:peptide/nickel transport system permease protein
MRPHRISIATILAGAWLTIIAVAGILAPVLASSLPLIVLDTPPSTTASPLLAHLRPIDFALGAGLVLAVITLLVPARSALRRVVRASIIVALALGIGAAFESATPVRLRVYDAHARADAGEIDARFTVHEFSPDERIAGARLAPPGTETPDGRTFLLGADTRGQDVLAQLIHGARTAVLVSVGSALIAMALGIAVGACMGWFGGWIDTALMRIVEAAMSIPVLLILVVAAGVLPRQIGITILVIGLITWTDAARLTRAEFLRLRDQDFALAARASGASAWRIITLHLLPSALPPVLVEASFALAAAILFEASLSFLGLGPTEGASWGRLLAQGLDATGRPLWWITVPAGLLIFLTVVSLHAVGDTLRHRLSPIREAA